MRGSQDAPLSRGRGFPLFRAPRGAIILIYVFLILAQARNLLQTRNPRARFGFPKNCLLKSLLKYKLQVITQTKFKKKFVAFLQKLLANRRQRCVFHRDISLGRFSFFQRNCHWRDHTPEEISREEVPSSARSFDKKSWRRAARAPRAAPAVHIPREGDKTYAD